MKGGEKLFFATETQRTPRIWQDFAVGHAPYLHALEKECTNVIVIR